MPVWNKYMPAMIGSLRGQGFTINERGSGEGLSYEHTIVATKGPLVLNIIVPSGDNVKVIVGIDGITLPKRSNFFFPS